MTLQPTAFAGDYEVKITLNQGPRSVQRKLKIQHRQEVAQNAGRTSHKVVRTTAFLTAALLAGAQDVVFQSQAREVLLEVVVRRRRHRKLVTKINLRRRSIGLRRRRTPGSSVFRLVSGRVKCAPEMARGGAAVALRPSRGRSTSTRWCAASADESSANGQRGLPGAERHHQGDSRLRVRRGEKICQ